MTTVGNSGQLIRETYPVGNKYPAIMPQHVQPGGQVPELTEGSDGGLHTKILGPNGTPISSTNRLPSSANLQVGGTDVSGTNAVPTQLTGRNVEEIYFCNGLAITDTSVHTTPSIDLSKYKAVTFIAINTHDQNASIYVQDINLTVFYYDSTSSTFKGTSGPATIIPPGNYNNPYILNGSIPNVYAGAFYDPMRFVISFETAPTKGSITIKGWGLPN